MPIYVTGPFFHFSFQQDGKLYLQGIFKGECIFYRGCKQRLDIYLIGDKPGFFFKYPMSYFLNTHANCLIRN